MVSNNPAFQQDWGGDPVGCGKGDEVYLAKSQYGWRKRHSRAIHSISISPRVGMNKSPVNFISSDLPAHYQTGSGSVWYDMQTPQSTTPLGVAVISFSSRLVSVTLHGPDRVTAFRMRGLHLEVYFPKCLRLIPQCLRSKGE